VDCHSEIWPHHCDDSGWAVRNPNGSAFWLILLIEQVKGLKVIGSVNDCHALVWPFGIIEFHINKNPSTLPPSWNAPNEKAPRRQD